MKIIRWTFWGDPIYPEAEWSVADENNPYETAVIEAIKEKGYRFSGIAHQGAQYGVPVFDDGKQFNVSMRHWGGIMAEALGIEGEYAYVDWAWIPPEKEMHFPDPTEWNESPEESAVQRTRWEQSIHESLMQDIYMSDALESNDASSAEENPAKKETDPGASKRWNTDVIGIQKGRTRDMRPKIIRNAVKCKHCGDVIESTYRHDFVTCSCRRVSVDGGHDYLRRCYESRDDFIELSETESGSDTDSEAEDQIDDLADFLHEAYGHKGLR